MWFGCGSEWFGCGSDVVRILAKVKGKWFPAVSGARNFLSDLHAEGVHPEIAPLQALCSVPLALEQSSFRGGEQGKMVPRKGEEEGCPARGQKGKRPRENNSAYTYIYIYIGIVRNQTLGKRSTKWLLGGGNVPLGAPSRVQLQMLDFLGFCWIVL